MFLSPPGWGEVSGHPQIMQQASAVMTDNATPQRHGLRMIPKIEVLGWEPRDPPRDRPGDRSEDHPGDTYTRDPPGHKNLEKKGFRAKLKAWITDNSAYQNQLLRLESGPAWLEPL